MCKWHHRVVRSDAYWVLVGMAAVLLPGQSMAQDNNAAVARVSQAGGQPNVGLLAPMAVLRDFHSKRASSWEKTGQNRDFVLIAKNGRHELLNVSGPGCIKHFYWTYYTDNEEQRLNYFRGLVLRIYWDGAEVPSVEVPLGDFFGVSNGVVRPIRSLAFVTNPGTVNSDGTQSQNTWGFNCYLPMPFARGARIEIENTGAPLAGVWYHVHYELYDDASALPAGAGRLHAAWRRENPTAAIPWADTKDPKRSDPPNLSERDNYVILDTEGDGQFVGYFMTVVNLTKDWWGEGDDMIFIDGESFPPTYHGTGTEEIFGGGACPNQEYTGPYTGFHYIENREKAPFFGGNGMYRFCVSDPIRFRKSIRVSIEHGHANNCANDYSSVAFWYQREPNRKREPLPPLEQRLVRR